MSEFSSVIPATQIQSAAAAISRAAGGQLRQSDYRIISTQSMGVNAGSLLKGGGGLAELQIRSNDAPFYYSLIGLFGEAGVGAGYSVGGNANFALRKAFDMASNLSGSAASFPSYASPLFYGPAREDAAIAAGYDFYPSTWLYVNAAFASILIGMDAGILMLMDDPEFSVEALPKMMRGVTLVMTAGAAGAIIEMLLRCKVFCIYWGLDATLGASVGVGVRLIRISNPTQLVMG